MAVAPILPHLFIPEDGPPLKEIKRLGGGASAKVFVVETPTHGTHCALKVSREGRYAEVEEEAKLLKDLQRLALVKHYIRHFKLTPETEQAPAQVAILMKLLPANCCVEFEGGATLEEINRIKKLALKIFAPLHSKKMMHGDIKPENMSYNRLSGELNIIDFGSTHHERQYHPEHPGGTKEFLPPECMLGLPYNTKRDIWSLGVTLFELYTGRDFLPRELLLDDRLYLLRVNMGVCLSSESPSVNASAALEELKRIEATERYNGMPMWEARVYNAAHQRYASDPIAADKEAETVIDLITPMLQYHLARRATAQQLLQKFEDQ